MKVFISADIEGIAATTRWEELDVAGSAYAACAKRMTEEVVAACEGAIAAGATEIWVKDAHSRGTNIDVSMLPEEVTIVRGWDGHPYMMVQGIDSSFDAAMFIGYHSEAGSPGNPLCHTMSTDPQHVFINGKPCSEFMIYSFCAAYEHVPTVFLSGDRALCEQGKALYPWLITAAVKEGRGRSTVAMAPKRSCRVIREGVQEALSKDLSGYKFELPKHFVAEIEYKDHNNAAALAYFPGVERVDAHTLRFEENDWFETARKLKFLL